MARPGLSGQRSTRSIDESQGAFERGPQVGREESELARGEWLPWLEAVAFRDELSFRYERCEIRPWRFRRSREMRIIVILLSLMTLALGGCQGNRLNGSTAAPVAVGGISAGLGSEANTARKLAAMSSISVQVIAIEGW
jgi:hypothetical protein